jgi:hypothetical protein
MGGAFAGDAFDDLIHGLKRWTALLTAPASPQ